MQAVTIRAIQLICALFLWAAGSAHAVDVRFERVADGVYSYSGPYTAGTGTATLQVTITSATTLWLDQTFYANAEPTCAHTYTQTGTFVLFDTR